MEQLAQPKIGTALDRIESLVLESFARYATIHYHRRNKMSFHGSCHCGAVTFTVEAELPDTAIICNCSHCRRKGFLLSFFPADRFSLTSGENRLRTYTFHTHKIEHRFCETCGTEPFAYGINPDGSAVRAVNLRCVPSIDLDALSLQPFDGASR